MWNSFKTGQVGFSTRIKPQTPMPGNIMGNELARQFGLIFERRTNPAEYPTLAGRMRVPGA